MMSKRSTFSAGAAFLLMTAVACDQGADRITAGGRGSSVPRQPQRSIAANALYVTNVEQLYAEVNNPENEGAVITLAPGRYVLSAKNPLGVDRSHGGRLELQLDMSLYGVSGDRSAVVIDATGLDSLSFMKEVSFGRSGAVRIGRGSNTVEWLTVLGNPASAAGIAAELTGTATTRIRVAHVVSSGSSRGVDIRNAGAPMIGRRIEAEIFDNEFIGPTEVQGMSEGIRVANFVGADHGIVVATLSGNRARGFQLGCIIANNKSSNGVVEVRSSSDRFIGNALGCLIAGGLNLGSTGVANSNRTTFEARRSQFVANRAQIPGIEPGGLRVVGGLAKVKSYATSDNTVSVTLWNSVVSGNQVVNLEAFGAWQQSLTGIAGTNNRVTIELYGASEHIDVVAMASLPVDVNGTNQLQIIR
jgi:hypothetical protein